MKKTLKADYEYFKLRCKHWISFFGGLPSWNISYTHEEFDLNDGDQAQAWARVDYVNSMACIAFNKEWIDDISFYNKEAIDFIAFHEVCEVLFAEIEELGHRRFNVSQDDFLHARHKLIHLFENSVFKAFKA